MHLEASASARKVDVYRRHHRTMLWISLAVIAASFFLRRTGSESVRLVWSHIELPPLCASRMFFGVECPGCGLTRSFVALAHGDLLASWQLHRVGWLLALAVVGQIPYRLYASDRLKKNATISTWPTWFGRFLIAALVANWLLKVSGI